MTPSTSLTGAHDWSTFVIDIIPVCSPQHASVIFVIENENGEKRENNEFVNRSPTRLRQQV